MVLLADRTHATHMFYDGWFFFIGVFQESIHIFIHIYSNLIEHQDKYIKFYMLLTMSW